MTDLNLRTLERSWTETGAVGDEIAFRSAQQRAGVLSEDERLELQALKLQAGWLKPTPYRLLHDLPGPGRDDDVELDWFLRKASFGSCKAPGMLDRTQEALVERLSAGDDGLSETYDETLARALPLLPPYPTQQPWLDQLIHTEMLDRRVVIGEEMRAPPERYQDAWESAPASCEDLLHDTLWFCWHRWSGEVFVRVSKAGLRNPEQYSSLELCAAMMFTIAAWSVRG